MIKLFSIEHKKKIPISTKNYKDRGVMEKYSFDVTLNIRIQKKGMTTTEVDDSVIIFL